jgi:uncharacterized YccA/Bax inhibitor family protein
MAIDVPMSASPPPSGRAMSLSGMMSRFALQILIMGLVAVGVFIKLHSANPPNGQSYFLIGGVGGLLALMVTMERPEKARYTAPLTAVLAGLALGSAPSAYEKFTPLIALHAVVLAVALLSVLCVAYRFGWVSENTRVPKSIRIAFNIVIGVFVANLMTNASEKFFPSFSFLLHVAYCILLVIFGAAYGVRHFAAIQSRIRERAPQSTEWYSAFTLVLTLCGFLLGLSVVLIGLEG